MNIRALSCRLILSIFVVGATIILSTGSVNASMVPSNAYLADSSWPLFHRNSYAQASGDLDAVSNSHLLGFQRIDNPERGTAPWTVFLAPYSDGSQAAISNTQKGVVKWLLHGESFSQVSYRRLARKRMDFDWNVAALASGEIVVTSISDNRFYLLADERPDCPHCELEVKRIFEMPQSVGQLTIHFTISYDGHILVLLEGNQIAAVSLADGAVVAKSAIGKSGNGYSYHNAFATDESGRIFISSQQGVSAIDWDGTSFIPAWEASYDFRGPGCREPRRESRIRERLKTIRGKKCTGTGTTPSLIGSAKKGLVVMVDGHSPRNNLVGFWRNEMPAGWRGKAGQHRRFADRIPLPNSTPDGEGHSAENSPAVIGNSVFVAQWAGFRPDCTPPKGVQRVNWSPTAHEFELAWVNGDVHFNGIPTVSSKTGLVYGTGRGVGCTYAYTGVDMDTGEVRFSLPLGDDDAFTDQGNQQAVANDGSIVVGVRRGTLRVYKKQN